MGASSSVFTYQGVNLLFERNLTSGIVTDRVYGDGMQLAKVSGGTTTYFHEDRLGSNRAETSVAKGKVDTQFSSGYQPYGQSYGATGSEAFRFTDRMLDSSTGLYYMGARLYDPSIMRFLQKDPGGSDAVSAYMYANDNPLGYTDPTGADSYPIMFGGAGGICSLLCAHPLRPLTELYNLYRDYQLHQAALGRGCIDGGDHGACKELALDTALGLTGGVGGDVVEQASARIIDIYLYENEARSLAAAVGFEIPSSAAVSKAAEGEIIGQVLRGVMKVDWGVDTLGYQEGRILATETLAGRFPSGMAVREEDIMTLDGTWVVESKGTMLGRFRLDSTFKSEISDMAAFIGGDIEGRGASVVFGNWRGPPVVIWPSVLRFLSSKGIGEVYRLNIAWGINIPTWL